MAALAWLIVLLLGPVGAMAGGSAWPGGVRMTANAWEDADGDIVQAWAPHPGGRQHRSYHQVLFCDVEEHEVERAMTTPLGFEMEKVPGLRFAENESDPLFLGPPLWDEFCGLDLYALGQVWIERNRGPRGLYRKRARQRARKYAELGWTDGLTADEYLCAYVLRHPPAYLEAAIRRTGVGSLLRLELVLMKFDPDSQFHRKDRAAWAYYGVDHNALCGGLSR